MMVGAHEVLQVRVAVPNDYPAIAEVSAAAWPDRGISLARLLEQDQTYKSSEYFRKYFVAEEEGHKVVGFGLLSHSVTEYHPNKLNMELAVPPEWRGVGIGSKIYDFLMQETEGKGFKTLWAETRNDFYAGVRFLNKRGFIESRRKWESVLELDLFDPEKFRSAVEGIDRIDVMVTNAKEEKSLSEDWERKFYALNIETAFDVPRSETYTPPNFEQAMMHEVRSPDFMPELCLIAKKNGEYVARTGLVKSQSKPNALITTYTCTKKEYRNKGIALALKALSLQRAKEMGFKTVSTINDSLNKPMLSTNQRLGFLKRAEWIRYEKTCVK